MPLASATTTSVKVPPVSTEIRNAISCPGPVYVDHSAASAPNA
jgi:hypothetical protein